MNKLRLYAAMAAGLLLIAIQPLLYSGTEALPPRLSETSQRVAGEQQKLTASDGTRLDDYGSAVVVDGDTALIGSPNHENGSQISAGAVYVYVWSGELWIEQAKLTASDSSSGDRFGIAAAFDGDTAVIGAWGDDINGQSEQGSAYVFVRNGTSWTQQQKLTANDGERMDYFGRSVAIVGDTVLIGAFQNKVGANFGQGSVYVFTRNDTTWTQQQKLIPSNASSEMWFGYHITVNADTAIIGAPFDSSVENEEQGSAFVFVRNGNTWSEQQKLFANDGGIFENFGSSVALDGDTALIGAHDAHIGTNNRQGAVYTFVRSGGVWTPQQKLTASDGSVDDRFGRSVTVEGDIAIIGAFGNDIGTSTGQGSAYMFKRSGMNWIEDSQLIASDGASEDDFGVAVAMSGNTVLIGSPSDEVGGDEDQGSAYVFVEGLVVPTATPSATPGPTPTLEPGAIELIQDGGFEWGNDTPWFVKNSSDDLIKCNRDMDGDGIPDEIIAYRGSCIFQITKLNGVEGQVSQRIDLNSFVLEEGDQFRLSFYSRSVDGGARAVGTFVVRYSDGSRGKLVVEGANLDMYTPSSGSQDLTGVGITKSKVSLKVGVLSGKVYVDDVSLVYLPN